MTSVVDQVEVRERSAARSKPAEMPSLTRRPSLAFGIRHSFPPAVGSWRWITCVSRTSRFLVATTMGLTCCVAAAVTAQRRDVFIVTRDHAAIKYSAAPVSTAVTALNRALSGGSKKLAFDPKSGYLKSVLEALDVPVESQALVFSPTSFQAELINMHNPRAVFFNDTVSVGWVRGADVSGDRGARSTAGRDFLFARSEKRRCSRAQTDRPVSVLPSFVGHARRSRVDGDEHVPAARR